ncbi:GIY-YIG nuclease family protein [bacterium]|jgi:putative endonuclease|nr:GIY-YIG nuclease family protein [Candidatus Komeilibacteria bacterium]MBT7553251.1 GIY-YIG nuclease family protein [bacterium]
MYYVYILKLNSGKFYIGYTKSIKRRLAEHKNNKTYFVGREKSFDLIYFEAFSDIDLAKEREDKLKQYGSAYHGLLKRIKAL